MIRYNKLTTIFISFVIVTLVSFLFTCTVQAREFISFGTGSPAGTYYFLGAGFASMVNEKVDGVQITPESTAASTENCRLMQRGYMQMGLACMGTLQDMQSKDENIDKMRLVAIGHTSDVHWIVPEDSPIKSVSDFKGKTVAVGPSGSATLNIVGKQHLEKVWGLSFDDFDAKFLSFDEVTRGIRDGTLDAGLIFAGYPLSSVMRLSNDVDIRILDIKNSEMKELRKHFGNVVPLTIPPNTYPNINKEINTYCVPQMWLCRKDLSKDLVYKIIKTIYENPKEKNKIHPMAKKYTIENAFRGANNVPVKYHPGAIKYYKEKNIWNKRQEYYE